MDNISTYIFIDNLSDYKFFQNKFNKEGTIWVSSSPHVLQKVKRENKQVINLESFINKGQINFLMKLSYKISEKIILKNSSKIKFINKKDYKILFYRDLAGMIGSYLYKFFALSNLIKKKKKSNFVFIGNIIEKKEVDHLMSPNDNVIFDIAKKLNNKNFKFINSISEKKKIFSFRLIILSKIISILNLNFNSFFYKLYKKFYFKIYNLKKKNIYIFKEVNNFQNNFFKIKKNFNIHFIDFKINKLKFISNKEKNNLLIENINNFVVHNLKKKK